MTIPFHSIPFQTLSAPLTVLQLRVTWLTPKGELEQTYTLLIPKDATVAQLIERLKPQVPLQGTKELRVMEVTNYR